MVEHEELKTMYCWKTKGCSARDRDTLLQTNQKNITYFPLLQSRKHILRNVDQKKVKLLSKQRQLIEGFVHCLIMHPISPYLTEFILSHPFPSYWTLHSAQQTESNLRLVEVLPNPAKYHLA